MKKLNNMIEFGGTFYHLDVDALEDAIKLRETSTDERIVDTVTTTNYDSNGKVTDISVVESSSERGREIDATKYDFLRICVEVIIDYHDEIDDTLGVERALEKTTLPFRLAFNTLLKYGILTEVEIDEEEK